MDSLRVRLFRADLAQEVEFVANVIAIRTHERHEAVRRIDEHRVDTRKDLVSKQIHYDRLVLIAHWFRQLHYVLLAQRSSAWILLPGAPVVKLLDFFIFLRYNTISKKPLHAKSGKFRLRHPKNLKSYPDRPSYFSDASLEISSDLCEDLSCR